jgi:hypothetical protein
MTPHPASPGTLVRVYPIVVEDRTSLRAHLSGSSNWVFYFSGLFATGNCESLVNSSTWCLHVYDQDKDDDIRVVTLK